MCLIILSTLLLPSEMDVNSLLTMHTAALQSISTLQCDMEIEQHNKEKIYKGSGAYVRSGTSAKAIEKNLVPGRKIESLSINGITKRLMFANGNYTVGIFDSRLEILTECDAWFYALLIVRRPGKLEPISLSELVSESQNVTVRETTSEGIKRLVLKMSYSNPKDTNERWDINIEFNPTKNYLINNIKYYSVGSTYPHVLLHYHIPSFQEVASGIYFPQRLVYDWSVKEERHGKILVTFKNLQCNKPINNHDLTIRYPRGVKVRDLIRGTMYNYDENGSIISKEVPINHNSKPLENTDIKAKPSDTVPKKVVYDTSAESQSWPWIVYVLLGVVAISIGYFVYTFLVNRLSSSKG
ncbi:MAG: hypothetical protein JNJ77_16010 [Planctomycetia bacterium]|nr:hypothetical protein [Planctomycetia bacterium]